MTELEQYIYDQVIERLPNMIEGLKNHKYDGLVQYPFHLDGCINSVLFELQNKVAKPIHIEYKYGVGEATPLIGGSTALFDEFEIRQIPFKQ